MLIRLKDNTYEKVNLNEIINVNEIKIGIDKRDEVYYCTHYFTGILIKKYKSELKKVIRKIKRYVIENYDSIINLASQEPIINKE